MKPQQFFFRNEAMAIFLHEWSYNSFSSRMKPRQFSFTNEYTTVFLHEWSYNSFSSRMKPWQFFFTNSATTVFLHEWRYSIFLHEWSHDSFPSRMNIQQFFFTKEATTIFLQEWNHNSIFVYEFKCDPCLYFCSWKCVRTIYDNEYLNNICSERGLVNAATADISFTISAVTNCSVPNISIGEHIHDI
jgi:hypothetical protein